MKPSHPKVEEIHREAPATAGWDWPRATSLLPLGLVLLAAGLRFFRLGEMSLWYDEAFGVLLSRDGPGSIVARTAVDTLPPLYYVILYGWSLIDTSEFMVRMPSAVFGIATVALLYRLGTTLFDKRVGLVAGFLAALSPFQVFYSQEVRMYALLGLLSVLGVLIFYRAWQTNRKVYWAGYALVSAAALYTHSMAALTIVALLAFAAADRPRARANLWGLGGSHLALGIIYLPWLYFLPAQISLVARSFWAPRPSPLNLLTALHAFTFGSTLPPTVMPMAFSLLLVAVALSVFLAVKVILSGSLKKRRGDLQPNRSAEAPLKRMRVRFPRRASGRGDVPVNRLGERIERMPGSVQSVPGNPLTAAPAPEPPALAETSPGHRQSLLLVACWLGVPLLATYAISLYKSLFLDRALISSSLALAVLLAWGIFRIRPRPVAIVLAASLGAFLAFSLFNWHFDVSYAKPPMREAARFVGGQWKSGDALGHTSDGSYLPFAVYLSGISQKLLWGDPELLAGSVRAKSTVKTLGIKPERIDEAFEEATRIWLVVALDHSVDWQRSQKAIFDERSKLLEERDFRGIGVLLYRRE